MNALANIVKIYRALTDKEEHDSTLEGSLKVCDDETCAFLRSAVDESTSTDYGLVILSDTNDIHLNATVQVRLITPKCVPVFRNISSFLGNGSRLLEPIGNFYIIDDDWSSEDQPQPDEAANLEALHRIILQLSEAATVVDRDKGKLVFADGVGLVDLPINISLDDLKAVKPQNIEAFENFCSEPLHQKHRLEAVANVVIRRSRGIVSNNRIPHILQNLETVLSDIKSQHSVFLSAFSYEKVRDEIESLKIEYTTKIHKILSEIQGQLLGIPAATVIVATQMKKADLVNSSVFITNTAILLGAFIFGIFLIFLLVNQSHILEILKTEVERQKRQLRSELSDVEARFNDIFNLLQSRIRYQKIILWIVGFVVVIGLSLGGFVFWVQSSHAIITMLYSNK
ncbi:hypothetical protein SAMN05216302_102144 [Nitrosomonas aestuarii]|uniref:Phage-related membrane protein n=1 Tax=Nitrosomonas aestuarii TaxID=52441 RepID=A0A1I4DIP5_9PROT|nr:hypothetical protein [Nitrosomonas aestuarii]SFK92759.1 hypothetical protein SAMN05216302_102144 [Nitrosomonas aestuarii]